MRLSLILSLILISPLSLASLTRVEMVESMHEYIGIWSKVKNNHGETWSITMGELNTFAEVVFETQDSRGCESRMSSTFFNRTAFIFRGNLILVGLATYSGNCFGRKPQWIKAEFMPGHGAGEKSLIMCALEPIVEMPLGADYPELKFSYKTIENSHSGGTGNTYNVHKIN